MALFRKPDPIAVARDRPRMDRGRYTFVLDIPPGFNGDVLAGPATGDAAQRRCTQMSYAFIGTGYISSIVKW